MEESAMTGAKRAPKYGINAAFLQEIKEDHRQLDEHWRRLQAMATESIWLARHYQVFVDELFALCDQLALHFALEEAYGYFEDVLEATPHLHAQAARLKGQHPGLFVWARDLADQAAAERRPSADAMQSLVAQFQALAMAYRAHDTAERALIVSAVHQDVGVGD
jgi:hypothetical protein